MDNRRVQNAAGGPARRRRGRPRAFTLVEMLMVIAIIGILIGLVAAVAFNAISKAKRAAVVAEIDSLAGALEKYKTDHGGSYPPNCGSSDRDVRIVQHLRQAFPRFIVSDYVALRNGILAIFTGAAVPYPAGWGDIDFLDQAEALVFWIGGLPSNPDPLAGDADGGSSTRLIGFSANVSNPFALGGSRIRGDFEFNELRLVDNDDDGWLEYIPELPADTPFSPPYVYFDSLTYTSTTATFAAYPPTAVSDWGFAVPYAVQRGAQFPWVNPEKFQIICAGQDSQYGETATLPRVYLADQSAALPATNLSPFDRDNLTNFVVGTLQEAQP